MKDLVGLGEVMQSEVANRTYNDLASGPLVEIGKLATDTVRTARLILAPIQMTSALQKRFENYIRRFEQRTPEEFRVEPNPQISGPALESMRYIDEGNELWEMFCELLSKSADSRALHLAHPSFVHILKQLSRDEAYLLEKLKTTNLEHEYTLDLGPNNKLINKKTVISPIPTGELHRPESFDIYTLHLGSLSLTKWVTIKEEPIRTASGVQSGIRHKLEMRLTEFGALFIEACT